MADFPTLKHTTNSRRSAAAGRSVDYAEDGVPRVRTLYSVPRYVFDLDLICTTAERTALLDHYGTSGPTVFAYTWPEDSVSYNARYAEYPQSRLITSSLWRMTVKLEGVVA